jgi:tetratricopeptide (TPR) repeat protein
VLLWAVLAVALFQSPAQRASALVDAGVELSNQGKFEEAGEKFVQALALDPNLAEAHYLLGLVRQNDGRNEAALQSFRTAVKLNPRFGPAQSRVCEIDTNLARIREAGYDAALASCRRAAVLDPKDAEARFHAGWNLAQLGNHNAAAVEYRAALKLDPALPNAKFELAMAYAAQQDLARAIPLFKEVAESEPRNTNARFQLGSSLVKTGDCGSAVTWLETATESSQKYYLLSGCLKKLNRPAEAAAAMEKVKALREGGDARMQAKFTAALAHKSLQAGALDEAIAHYRSALALSRDPTIAVDLAVALLRNGEPREVLELLKGESDPLARYQVALAHAALGQMGEARTTLELVLRERPRFVEAWYQLGLTLLTLGDAGPAEAALRTAVQLRPDEAALRLAWAETLEKLGRTSEAAEQRRLTSRFPK